MALTRKSLRAMGLTDEQVDSIVEMHSETVDGLKEQLKAANEKIEKLDGVEKELSELKAKGEDDYKSKYEQEHKDFETYKKAQVAKETQAAKEKAARAYFESKNITGANLDIAMMGAANVISALELDGENIKDSKALDDLVKGTFAGLVVTKSKQGAATATPPANTGGGKMMKEDILKIKDTAERQQAIAENLNLFRRG